MSGSTAARRTVTLKDVAARVGVTSAAASMALSDHARISDRTKAAVRRAADELGYVPSSAGRALRSRRSGALALIVPETSQHVFGHSYFMHVLTGVSTAANARDRQVIVSTNPDEAHGMAAFERVMRSRSADGAIVTSAAVDDVNVEKLVASGLPVVLIGNFPGLPQAPSVGVDDVAATRRITRHLIEEHGRRRLVHVAGPLDHQTGLDRQEGFRQAVREAGIDAGSVVLPGDFGESSGAAAVTALLDEGTPFDGIVFANDDMAFGGLQVLKAAGMTVPGDVAIVGFDDFGLSRLTTPGITTVRVPAEEMARIATERLFALVDAETPDSRDRADDADDDRPTPHDELPVELILRDSCGCGPSAAVSLPRPRV